MPPSHISQSMSTRIFGLDESTRLDNELEDSNIVRVQQGLFRELIRNNDAEKIDNLLKDSSQDFQLSSGPCKLPRLLERCEPPLMLDALRLGRSDALRALIQHMPVSAVNAADVYGYTLLMSASEAGLLDDVNLLLAAGAVADAANHKGETSLMLAALKGFANIVAALIGYVAFDNNRARSKFATARNDLGENALMLAIKGGHVDVVKTIVGTALDQQFSLDVRACDNREYTLLSHARASGNKEILEQVIKAIKAETGKDFEPYLRSEGIAPDSLLYRGLMELRQKADPRAPAPTSPSPSSPPASEPEIGRLMTQLKIGEEHAPSPAQSKPRSVLDDKSLMGTVTQWAHNAEKGSSNPSAARIRDYVAVGEVIVNTLHGNEPGAEPSISVQGEDGALIPLKNTREITHAIAWYGLTEALRQNALGSGEMDDLMVEGHTRVFVLPDPNGNLFRYLETLSPSSDEHEPRISRHAISDDMRDRRYLVTSQDRAFPGLDGRGMVYGKQGGSSAAQNELMFYFPESTDYDSMLKEGAEYE